MDVGIDLLLIDKKLHDNNSPKTAIIRALMLCLYNIPKGNEYIRTGAKECEVTVRFNDNSYIKRTRTLKSTGTYTVCTADGEIKEFDSFANNLPIDLENEHQMPFINISKGVDVNINISEQLDGPFLLRETSSVKANAVGKITKTDKVDLSIKNLSSDAKSTQKEIKLLTSQISEKEEELNKYKNLDKKKALIDELQGLFALYEVQQAKYNEIRNYHDRLNAIDEKIKMIKEYFNNVKDTDLIKETVDKLKDKLNSFSGALEFIAKEENLNKKINECKKYFNNVKDINTINKTLDTLKDKLATFENTIEKYEELSNINNSLNKNANTLTSIKGRINEIKDLASKNKHEKEKLEKELISKIDELKLCPVCGSEIDNKCKDFIMS